MYIRLSIIRNVVSDVKKYDVIAYPDEDGYPRKETTISAENQQQAESIAWRLFPEYHEIGVYEIEEK